MQYGQRNPLDAVYRMAKMSQLTKFVLRKAQRGLGLD